MLKTILIDVKNMATEVVEINDDIDTFHELIGCRCIDITTRKVAGEYYDIMCDDEGLLIDDAIPSAITPDGYVQLVGNLMLFKNDDSGNLMSLSDKDIKRIRDKIFQIQYYSSNGYVDGIVLMLGEEEIGKWLKYDDE